MLRIVEEDKSKTSYSLFVQYTPEYGLELSDMGMDWAIAQQDEMPVDADPKEYYLKQIEGMSETVKALMLECWQVSDALVVKSANVAKSTL